MTSPTTRGRRGRMLLAILCSAATLGLGACGDDAEEPNTNFESEKNTPEGSDSLPDTRTTLTGDDDTDGEADGVGD